MRVSKILAGIGICAIIMLGTETAVQAQERGQAQPQEQIQTDYESFRLDLITFIELYGDSDSEIIQDILAMSSADLEEYYFMMSDPTLFAQANEQAGARQILRQQLQLSPEPLSHAPSSSFPPDYPSGANYDAYIATLPGLGIMLNGPTNRTDASAVGGAWIAFDTLEFLALAAQAVCDAASFPVNIVACAAAGVANAAARADQVVLQQSAYQDGLIDGAEIEAAYENSKTIIGQGNDLNTDLAAHDANIDGDLVAHNSNLNAHNANLNAHNANLNAHNANLNAHDANLAAHDANIDGDLQTHDADIKGLLGDVQEALDDKIELRKVHMQVIEILQAQRYLVTTTEAGLPVSVEVVSIEVFNESAAAFQSIPTATATELEPGLYDVHLNLPPRSPNKVYRMRVRHDEDWDHFGEIIFRWYESS